MASPIGIGREAVWKSLIEGRSGVRAIKAFDTDPYPVRAGGRVVDFDPKLYVTPRKSLKVMSREIQFGFAAARLALEDAGITTGTVDPDRYGVVFGCDMIYTEGDEVAPAFRSCTTNGKFDFDRWGHNALSELFPLWLLKGLPNMPACHIAIVEDARGPNNSIVMSEASSLLALAEAVSVIERDWADVYACDAAIRCRS
jgi:3-oxoacyl-[acyl-carrier-protein] synthase II